ncbi:MAG: Obg family GTPase CgtA [Candidatus Omnitrophica bacterium]|nr:Obg family GTPase CgtA [Candidatus Omnitrophota bacterium]
MFVDRAKIYVQAGDGGKGCESQYYKRGWRHARRDGGDGGNGGSIIVKADVNVHTLLDYRYRQHFKAQSGKLGGSNNKRGADALDSIILVPPGTIIRDADTGCLIRDLNKAEEQVIVVRGGRGGIGNFKRHESTPGDPGEQVRITFELKLIADIGLIGYPNAGKSSFINKISKANSKVAQFPFTTLSPVLGVVNSSLSESRMVIADIPGIIKDAHQGKGLGIEFLRHIERTKILLFVIDMAGIDGRDPINDYSDLLNELQSYDHMLLKKPQLIIANKMDLAQAKENLINFKKSVRKIIYQVSCVESLGIEKIKEALFKKLGKFKQEHSD